MYAETPFIRGLPYDEDWMIKNKNETNKTFYIETLHCLELSLI